MEKVCTYMNIHPPVLLCGNKTQLNLRSWAAPYSRLQLNSQSAIHSLTCRHPFKTYLTFTSNWNIKFHITYTVLDNESHRRPWLPFQGTWHHHWHLKSGYSWWRRWFFFLHRRLLLWASVSVTTISSIIVVKLWRTFQRSEGYKFYLLSSC